MKVGETVKIKNTNSVFDDKTGLVEWIDEEGGTCTVFVDFVPGQNKKVRQDFSLDNLEFYNADDDISSEEDTSIQESLTNYFKCESEDVIQLDDNVYEILGERYWIGTSEQEETYLKESQEIHDEEDNLEKDLEEFLTKNHMIDSVILESDKSYTTNRLKISDKLVAYKLN